MALRYDLAAPCRSLAASTFPGLSVFGFQGFILLLSACVCEGNRAFCVYVWQLNSWKWISFPIIKKKKRATNTYLLSYSGIPKQLKLSVSKIVCTACAFTCWVYKHVESGCCGQGVRFRGSTQDVCVTDHTDFSNFFSQAVGSLACYSLHPCCNSRGSQTVGSWIFSGRVFQDWGRRGITMYFLCFLFLEWEASDF